MIPGLSNVKVTGGPPRGSCNSVFIWNGIKGEWDQDRNWRVSMNDLLSSFIIKGHKRNSWRGIRGKSLVILQY